jgi:ATP-dependent RNA helicase DeaD
VPTVSDLRRKRLEQTASSLREQLAAGGFEEARALVSSLAADFDIIDIAAAAIALAHAAEAGPADERELEVASVPEPRTPFRDRDRGHDRDRDRPRPSRAPQDHEGVARLFIGAGRKLGIRPADLVGAIAGETGLTSKQIGPIQITENFSLVGVPDEEAEDVIAALRATGLRGKRVLVRRDRDA